MGWAHVRDQGLAGLVLQLLEGGSTDVDRQGYSCGEGCAYGPGFQMAGAFSLQAEHDLSHAVDLFFTGSIFDCWAKLTGAAGYGEPLLEAPRGTASA
jgi:hypothetical protein